MLDIRGQDKRQDADAAYDAAYGVYEKRQDTDEYMRSVKTLMPLMECTKNVRMAMQPKGCTRSDGTAACVSLRVHG